jgi:ribosomal protein S18 acetylase RimI-like enzyme
MAFRFHLRTDMKDPELKYWTNPPNGFIVATKKSTDEIIGCVSYQKISESTVELNRLSVQSDARGLGIGQKLVQAVIKDAKDQGYKNVYLETSDAQIGAWQLYEKLGFIKLMKENSPVDNWTFIHGVIVFAYNYEI